MGASASVFGDSAALRTMDTEAVASLCEADPLLNPVVAIVAVCLPRDSVRLIGK